MAATQMTRNQWIDTPVHPLLGLAMFATVAFALAFAGLAAFALVLF